MKQDDIWRALDTLAAEHGLSVSGLARRAGLDPTTFIPAKRQLPDGRTRWPSTESIAKALEATRTSLDAFSALVAGARTLPPRVHAGLRRLPLLSLPGGRTNSSFEAGGRPSESTTNLMLPGTNDPAAYALAVADEEMAPVFREGDIVIASPAATIRHGDRVVVRLSKGALFARELLDRAARHLVLRSFAPPQAELRLETAEVAFLHRIVWASQ